MLKSASRSSHFLNIVLVNPEIPQNTGNIGRTCVGLGARLHLVGTIGFSLEEKALRRAGLDYWPKLDWIRHDSWDDFLKTAPSTADMAFFSTKGGATLWDWTFKNPCYLVFGSESHGFPSMFYTSYKENLVRIPTTNKIRSLNLATSVGIAAFEAVRSLNCKV